MFLWKQSLILHFCISIVFIACHSLVFQYCQGRRNLDWLTVYSTVVELTWDKLTANEKHTVKKAISASIADCPGTGTDSSYVSSPVSNSLIILILLKSTSIKCVCIHSFHWNLDIFQKSFTDLKYNAFALKIKNKSINILYSSYFYTVSRRNCLKTSSDHCNNRQQSIFFSFNWFSNVK